MLKNPAEWYGKGYNAGCGLVILVLVILISILLPKTAVSAVDVTLAWDASIDADGYKLYSREEGQSYNYSSPDWEGPGTTCTIYGLDDNTTYHFVVRAYNAHGDSGDSNEATIPLSTSPSISLSTGSLSNSCTEGSDAQSQTFKVWNSGSGSLVYAISDNRSWLSVSPSGGTSNGEQDTINVNYNTSGLSAGTYSATITVSDPNASNNPQTISVGLEVVVSTQPPATPIINSPNYGEMETDLLLTAQTEPFSDPDGDSHRESRWQIIKKQDSSVVLDITSSEHLTKLPVPHAVLDRDTTYLVRVQFYDTYSEPSVWCDPVEFTTVSNIVDFDSDGIPDAHEVDDTIDLNEDGIPDNDQPDVIKSIRSAVGGNKPFGVGKFSDSIDEIEVLEPINPSTILDKTNKPQTFLFGLATYRLRLNQVGATVLVRIYYSEDISDATQYSIYDTLNGWQDYTQYVTFNPDGRSVLIELNDGGHGDSDGMANGIIVDPGGVVGSVSSGGVDSSGAGGGCFIATAGAP